MKITKVDAIQIEDKPADQPGWIRWTSAIREKREYFS